MKYIAAVLIIAAPLVAQAADPIRVADNSTAQPRFFPLDAVRNGKQPQVKIKENTKLRPVRALRSDAASMNNGFFRIDRKTTVPTAAHSQALIITPSDSKPVAGAAPRVILGAPTVTPEIPANATAISTPDNPDPVLALFNNSNDVTMPSFRDALSGRSRGTTMPAVGAMHSWPLPATVTQKISSAYGYRADPINRKMQFHSGIDIAASPGTPVLATGDGQVTKVGSDGLYGQSISILHSDGSESQYGHLSSQSVTVGQRVKAGQAIGAVGSTGRVTGPHLDYRLSRNGVTLDPMKMLARPGTVPVTTTAVDSHVHPSSPASTRPRVLARSERLIVVR